MGEISFQGKPVSVGTVVVVDVDGQEHTGSLRYDGRYTINNIRSGPIRIAVRSPEPRDEESDKKSSSQWRAIPSKYADVATSGLTFQLNPGPNAFNVELTGKAP